MIEDILVGVARGDEPEKPNEYEKMNQLVSYKLIGITNCE